MRLSPNGSRDTCISQGLSTFLHAAFTAHRPRATTNDAAQMRMLAQQGLRQAAMARHVGLWRTSVRRVLAQQEGT